MEENTLNHIKSESQRISGYLTSTPSKGEDRDDESQKFGGEEDHNEAGLRVNGNVVRYSWEQNLQGFRIYAECAYIG